MKSFVPNSFAQKLFRQCEKRLDSVIVPELFSWVDEYGTGSGSDRVCEVLSSTSSKAGLPALHEMEELSFIASPTRSLPLPVLYSSTHNTKRLSRQIHNPIERSDFANVLSPL